MEPATASVLVDREAAVRRRAPVELEEPERVGLLHAPVELGLVDDDAERALGGSTGLLHHGRWTSQSAPGRRFPISAWCGA